MLQPLKTTALKASKFLIIGVGVISKDLCRLEGPHIWPSALKKGTYFLYIGHSNLILQELLMQKFMKPLLFSCGGQGTHACLEVMQRSHRLQTSKFCSKFRTKHKSTLSLLKRLGHLGYGIDF